MRRGLKFVPLALLLAVVVELAVFVGVGRALGFGVAVLLVFAASLLGLVLLRREGMRAWRGFRSAASAGQPPGGQVTDGLVGLGGALLLAVPGLVSDFDTGPSSFRARRRRSTPARSPRPQPGGPGSRPSP
ncbi:FxsA family protein, partial [Micromonospora chokoriensis]